MIQLSTPPDVEAVSRLYERIHDAEEMGHLHTGWKRGIYPTQATALESHNKGELYLLWDAGALMGAGIINKFQHPCYEVGQWTMSARPEDVSVLHTLAIDPRQQSRGYGRSFVRFYAEQAQCNSLSCLRMDTNAKNTQARAFYKKLGFQEAGMVTLAFNGIPDVTLVLLEGQVDRILACV